MISPLKPYMIPNLAGMRMVVVRMLQVLRGDALLPFVILA